MTEIYIGKYANPQYPQINNQDAYGLYDLTRSLIALAPDQYADNASRFLESVILQLLNKSLASKTGIQVFFYQTRINDNFREIKRLQAATARKLGVQFYEERPAIEYLDKLNGVIQRRYADFASAQVKSISEYNNKFRTKKQCIFYIIDGVEVFL